MAAPFRLPRLRSRMQKLRSSRGAIFRRTAWSTLKSHSRCCKWLEPGCGDSLGSSRSYRSRRSASVSYAALLKLAQNEGKQSSLGIEFQLPATHQELANQLGTVRELISRNLMRLQAEGLLDVDARQIVVKDMKGLSALLESNS